MNKFKIKTEVKDMKKQENLGGGCLLKCLKLAKYDMTMPHDCFNQNFPFLIVGVREGGYLIQSCFGFNGIFFVKTKDIIILK